MSSALRSAVPSGPRSLPGSGEHPRSGEPALTELGDAVLLELMAAGDERATAEFVRRFQRRVYGLALTIVVDPAAAEDVAQEALLRAWRHAGAYDVRRGSVVTWLLTITRNAAIDAVRVRRPVATAPDDLVELPVFVSTRDPGDTAAARADVGPLRDALRALPEEQRRAVVFAGVLGWTAQEISEREGIPLGTAKTRIRTGLRRLRVALLDDADA
jgi:RNA polymerase sigma-70 factor (ECF subfamily)